MYIQRVARTHIMLISLYNFFIIKHYNLDVIIILSEIENCKIQHQYYAARAS